jgi:hypothetical protein
MISNSDREILIQYKTFITFSKEDVQDMHTDMIDFIERINSFLSTTSE